MAKWIANTYVNVIIRVHNFKWFFLGDVPNKQGPSLKEKGS
jgi:hypothetical protein